MTTKCLFYDEGGRILPSSDLSDETLAYHVKVGSRMLVNVQADPATQYVRLSDKSVRNYTAAERAALAALPTGWTWQMPQRVAVDLRALAAIRAKKSAEITAAWVLADKTSFQHAGKAFRAEQDDITRILATNGNVALTQAMPDDWAGAWKAIDNSYLPVPDVAAWTAFYKSFVNQGLNNFKHAQNLKAQIAVADMAKLDTLTWASPDTEA